jgi:hypothetical protein
MAGQDIIGDRQDRQSWTGRRHSDELILKINSNRSVGLIHSLEVTGPANRALKKASELAHWPLSSTFTELEVKPHLALQGAAL